jgi:hypothetical protein
MPLIRYNPMIYTHPIKVLLIRDHSHYVSWSRVIHKRRTCFVIYPNRGVQILYKWIWSLYVTVLKWVAWYSSNEIGVHSSTPLSHLVGTSSKPSLKIKVSRQPHQLRFPTFEVYNEHADTKVTHQSIRMTLCSNYRQITWNSDQGCLKLRFVVCKLQTN